MLNEAAFVDIEQALEPLLLSEGADVEVNLLLESLDSAPYALEKKVVKGKGDISYIFADETGDRYRIQFLTGSKLGKGVAKVYVGKAKSEKLFVDKIDRFSNPRAMISTIISLFTEHLLTPEGMGLRGFVVDLSGAASVRAIPLMKKVINSTLRSKVKVVDGTYDPVPNRKYIWVTKATLKPAEVFDGEGVGSDAPWLQGVERKGSQATIAGKDGKAVPFDPMAALQLLANEVTAKLKGKYPKIEIRPSYNAQGKVGMLTPYIQGAPVGQSAVYALATLKVGPDSATEAKVITGNIQAADDAKAKKLAEIQEEKKRQNKLATDPLFYLSQMKPELEKQINQVYPNLNVAVSFKDPSREYNLAKVVLSIDGVKVGDASVLLFGEEPAKAMESIRASIKKEDWTRATKEVEASKVKSTTQTADGKVAKILDANAKKMIDLGMKDVKSLVDGRVEFKHQDFGVLVATFSDGRLSKLDGSVQGGRWDTISPTDSDYILKSLKNKDMIYTGTAVASSVRASQVKTKLESEVTKLKKNYRIIKFGQVSSFPTGGSTVLYRLTANAEKSALKGYVEVVAKTTQDGTDSLGRSSDGKKVENSKAFTKGLIVPVESFIGPALRDFEDVLGSMEYEEEQAIKDTKESSSQAIDLTKTTVKKPRAKNLKAYYNYPNGRWMAAATWNAATQELKLDDGSGGGIDTNSLLYKIGGQSNSNDANMQYIKSLILNKYGNPSTAKGLAQALKQVTQLDWWA